MMPIRTVNLLWERKIRGAYPVARYALDDHGAVTLALPRPLEARTYDLTRLSLDGSMEVRSSFSVETLLELEASAQSDSMIGMTSDDLYLLHAGSKSRFLADRRILFVDSALSMDGQTVAAGFSDMAASSFALAVGEIGGRVQWLREADAPLSAVALSPEGGWIAQGAETGMCWLFDAGRREYWMFEQSGAIRALACAEHGKYVAYGTSGGDVGLIDLEGTRRWEAHLNGEVAALALSGDGSLCAVLCRTAPDSSSARIYCLVGAGQIGWEYEAEQKLLGLALSPNGHYLATSARDGAQTIYEVIYGELSTGQASISLSDAAQQVETCLQSGNLEEAYRLLRAGVEADRTDTSGCMRLLQLRQEILSQGQEDAARQDLAQDHAAALAILERLHDLIPDEGSVVGALQIARNKRCGQLLAQARSHREAGDFPAAEQTLQECLTVDPLFLEARQELAALSANRAAQADAEAERLLATGQIEAGLALLERAQAASATPARAEKIRRAQIAMEFAAGMAAYQEKRYREAIFQFKKALVRDPDHSEARRYLAFAQRFEQDANEALNDRFGRLE